MVGHRVWGLGGLGLSHVEHLLYFGRFTVRLDTAMLPLLVLAFVTEARKKCTSLETTGQKVGICFQVYWSTVRVLGLGVYGLGFRA